MQALPRLCAAERRAVNVQFFFLASALTSRIRKSRVAFECRARLPLIPWPVGSRGIKATALAH